MVGPGALKPKVGDGIKSRRPFSAPVLHSFILLFFFFVLCLLLHLYWCVYNNSAPSLNFSLVYFPENPILQLRALSYDFGR